MKKNLDDLISLLSESPLFTNQVENLLHIQQQLQSDELVISVIGQFKRGKSSLINAILGADVLPVGIVPLTSVVTELRSGKTPRACVCYESGKTEEIPLECLDHYCSEQYNGSNYKKVRTVQVWTPSFPFGPHIVLADTPGVGSVNESNTAAATEQLIHSDAIIFVLSVDSPVSQTELDFLMQSQEYASKFYFAVNKMDLVSQDELSDFIQYCSRVIREHMGIEVPLYPVSALTKTGVEKLSCVLSSSLQQSSGQLLELSVSRKLNILHEQIKGILSLEMQASSAPAAELTEKLSMLDHKRTELLSFSDTLTVLARHHTAKLVEQIECTLSEEAEKIRKKLPNQCRSIQLQVGKIPLKQFKEEFQIQMEHILRDELTGLDQTGTQLLLSGYAEVVQLLCEKASDAERCLSRFLENEFGITYPIEEEAFPVSEQNDFLLHVGLRSLPKLHSELIDHLVPRRIAEARFLEECLAQAQDDVSCNFNNMLYNYRYKMQESLRPLCTGLSQRVSRTTAALDQVAGLLQQHLQNAKLQQSDLSEYLQKVIDMMEK